MHRTSKGSSIVSPTASGKIYVILCTVDVSDDSDGVLLQKVDNFVDNAISATNLANNLVMVSMEGIQHLTDTNREFWRVGVENARAINKSLAEA